MFNTQSPEAKFWDWFQRHSGELQQVRTGREPVLAELYAKLKRVHKDLVFEIGRNESGANEFIVSADGISETIPHVEKLVASAPEVAGWKVIQFRPRKDGMDLMIHNQKFSKDSVFYTSRPDKHKLNLWIYIDGLNPTNKREFIGACFILMDTVIGEYDVMTRIGHIEFLPLIDADGSQQPLRNLALEVDTLKGQAAKQ